MEAALTFLGQFIISVAIGLGFCVGFLNVYKLLKEKDYDYAFLIGFFLLILLGLIFILAGSLI